MAAQLSPPASACCITARQYVEPQYIAPFIQRPMYSAPYIACNCLTVLGQLHQARVTCSQALCCHVPPAEPRGCGHATACQLYVLLPCCQDKILTPKQVSGLENLAIPPLATLLEPLTGKQYCRVLFGTQLTAAISRAAAAAGCTSSCQLLWQTLTQQKPAADRQYMVLVTGQRRKVRAYIQFLWHHQQCR